MSYLDSPPQSYRDSLFRGSQVLTASQITTRYQMFLVNSEEVLSQCKAHYKSTQLYTVKTAWYVVDWPGVGSNVPASSVSGTVLSALSSHRPPL